MCSPAAHASVDETKPSVEPCVRNAREAQKLWASRALRQRLHILRLFRHLLAEHAVEVAELISPVLLRSKADTLTAEVLPLAEAVRFLERWAPKLLAPAISSTKNRPVWLSGLRLQVQRDPWGVVLVIGPSNYPLFLPGVQTLQALAAGNAVLWKPGHGGSGVARAVAGLLAEAGLPQGLLTITGESAEEAQDLLHGGVDKIAMTGSEASGKAVLRSAAEHLTPAVVELSGCDAMFVLHDADIGRSVQALLFGLHLNGSSTCIAPRRIFLHHSIAEGFQRELLGGLSTVSAIPLSTRTCNLVKRLLDDATAQGAVALTNTATPDGLFRPLILNRATPGMQIMKTDVFAPIAGLCSFETEDEALSLAGECPYALGATVFGGASAATAFARKVQAGIVVVNDMIVPTADPRISFGGRGRSGFGKSRGAEGLLEMTFSKTVAVQTSKRLRHLEPAHPQALALFSGFLKIAHGRGWASRARNLLALGKTLAKKSES